MFGLFKKRAPAGSFIIVAVKAAVMLRVTELENGGLYTTPEVLRVTTDAFAKEMGVDLGGNLREVTHTCVMKLLMEQKFLDRLIARAEKGPIGTLTENDEKEVTRILGDLLGI